MHIDKPFLVSEIENNFTTLFPAMDITAPGQCVHWSVATHYILNKHGYDCEIQAGSLNWPIIHKAQDDGINPTHYSFQFDPTSLLSLMAVANGNLPEIHTWVLLHDTHEIVDLSTRSLKTHCNIANPQLKWRTPDPPNYLWEKTTNLPEEVYYIPNPLAKKIIYEAFLPILQRRLTQN